MGFHWRLGEFQGDANGSGLQLGRRADGLYRLAQAAVEDFLRGLDVTVLGKLDELTDDGLDVLAGDSGQQRGAELPDVSSVRIPGTAGVSLGKAPATVSAVSSVR